MNLDSFINVAKLLRGRIIETNCILENTPHPLFGLDVVYKIGGVLMGHYAPLCTFEYSRTYLSCNLAQANYYSE